MWHTPKKNKFGNIKTVVDGITFASKAEAIRYQELKLLEKYGKIEKLITQPVFQLTCEEIKLRKYIGDFAYIENGKVICEDVKGVETAIFKMKWKIVKLQFPNTEFRIVKPNYGGRGSYKKKR